MLKKAKHLLQSGEILENVLKDSGTTLWDFDLSTKKIYARSHNIYELKLDAMSGKTPEEIVRDGFVNPEDGESFLKAAHRAAAGEKDVVCELRVHCGEIYRWDKVVFNQIMNKKGRCIGIVLTCVDIGAHKRAESVYRRQLKLSEEMNDKTLLAKGLHNLSQNMVENYERKQESGLVYEGLETYDEMLEKLALTAASEEKAQEIRRLFSRNSLIHNFYEEKTYVSVEYQRKIEDGQVLWVSTQCKTMIDPEQEEIICFVYTYDISDKIMESNIVENITNSQYDFIAVINTITHGIVMKNISVRKMEYPPLSFQCYDENCKYIVEHYVNDRERERTMRGLEFSNVIRQLEKDSVYVFTVSFYNDLGKAFHKKYLFTYLDATRKQIMLCRSDITDIYDQEQQQLRMMEDALKTARLANEAKTDFLARMSHDIRTPMNGIIGITQLMLDSKLPESIREDLEKIDSSAHFLLGLVNDILDMTKVESGNLVLHEEPYPVSEFKRYITAVIKPLCEQKGIKFVMELGMGEQTVIVDQLRFNQIFFNLLSNAVKFTKEGGNILLRIKANEIRDDKILLDFIVKDDGIGMSREFQQHMYENFSQEVNGTEGENRGSGLGLAIVNRLIRLMNGNISVNSELGKGTEFKVHLELNYIVEDYKNVVKSVCYESLLVNKRILLCEDHPLNREIIQKILNKEGMVVDSAENGKDGLMRFKIAPQDYYDAILMDIRMPVMDGLTAAREIRKVERPDAVRIPIIALTANAFADDIEKSREAGINEHLAKPIEPQKLYATLQRYFIMSS